MLESQSVWEEREEKKIRSIRKARNEKWISSKVKNIEQRGG